MNQKIELILTGGLPVATSGNPNLTASGVVDLHGTEPIQLNMAVADIKNIITRKSTFSQSFIVPGTANNNSLFNFIFEIGSDSQFDPRKKTPCQLLVDTIPVITTGNLQLTGIVVDDDKNISYEVTITDESENLIDSLQSKELTVLDYTSLDHIWDYNHIVNSWTGTSQPYFYPLIDYGYGLNLTDLSGITGVGIGQMYPSTQVKYIWDNIFSTAGYTYQSNFLNTNYFKNLYIPFNGSTDAVLDPLYLDQFKFAVQMPYSGSGFTQEFLFSFPAAPNGKNNNPDHTSNLTNTPANFPNALVTNSNYNFTTNHYISSGKTSQSFNVNLKWAIPRPSNLGSLSDTFSQGTNIKIEVDFYRTSWQSGTIPFDKVYDQIPGYGVVYDTPYNVIFKNNFQLNLPAGTAFQPTQIGEEFWAVIHVFIHMKHYQTTDNQPVNWFINLYSDVNNSTGTFYNTISNQLIPGIFIPYNSWIPKKIKQIDFLNSIIIMHNLYVTPDQNNPRNLIIEPRDDYYAAGVTRDWSSKLDLSKSVHAQLLSEQQNNRIIFTYKTDKDYYNDDYFTSTAKIFGDEYVQMNNEFTKDDKKIEVIFSPTPSVPVLETKPVIINSFPANTVNDFVLPNIVKVDSNGNYSRTDFNIRILQKNQNNLIELNGTESWKLAGNKFTSYPYLGMLNHPFSGDTDIAFGTVDYEYYALSGITSNNLVNRFYRKYLDQIIDKDGKLITAYFYLTPNDIQQFKFNDTIFVDGLTNTAIGEYFIVNSIKYAPTSNSTSEVELIQLPNKQVNVLFTPAKQKLTTPRNIINMGGNQVNSVYSAAIGNNINIGVGNWGILAIGKDQLIYGGNSHNILSNGSGTTIGGASYNIFVTGDYNNIDSVNHTTSILGDLNNIQGSNYYSNIFGDLNNINTGSTNTYIFGNGNLADSGTSFTTIYGNSNSIYSGSSFSTIFGSGNTVNSGLTNVVIYGTGVTATTSNTLYADNIVLSSGSSINGISISAITNSSGIWTSGSTGISSVRVINSSTTDATGNYALAEGFNAAAVGISSHAQNDGTTSFGEASHAEGFNTFSSGYTSHAEGYISQALGDQSHAEGYTTTAGGTASHAEGIFTTAIGNFTHSEGSGTTAYGHISHAEGGLTIASGYTSHAEGFASTANGDYGAHAEGEFTTASGEASHSEGANTIASGFLGAHAEGNATTASGNFGSHAEGNSTTAQGIGSHAEGFNTTSSNNYSHAEGTNSKALGNFAHAEGGFTRASADYSHAEGNFTTASGQISHAEGNFTTALGNNSHAGGTLSVASGNTSFVHGSGSTADGTGTIVLGSSITGTSLNHTVYVGPLVLMRLTTTEKNALTPINGMMVYDTTLDKGQLYEAGVWTNLI